MKSIIRMILTSVLPFIISFVHIQPDPSHAQILNKIYWASTSSPTAILRCNLDGSGAQQVVNTSFVTSMGMSVDNINQKVYWAEQQKIMRSNLDGSNTETLVDGGFTNPHALKLDIAGGKMYWTVVSTAIIQRANSDGSNVETIITGTNYYGLAIDPAAGKIYYTNFSSNGYVRRANLDGTGQETLIASGISYGNLALDLVNGKIYISEEINNNIRRANLDGSGLETIVTGLNVPMDIAVAPEANKIYWVESGDPDKIRSANLDGSNVQTLLEPGGNLSHIALYYALPPSAPTGFYAMSGDGQVTLKWNKNPESDIVRYRVFAGTSPNPDVMADSTTGGINDTAITISGLTNNSLYYFRITAVNASGQQSVFSNEDAAVPVVKAGNAITFNGSGQYMSANDVAIGTGDFTIELWLKHFGSSEDHYVITNRYDQMAGDGTWYALYMNSANNIGFSMGKDVQTGYFHLGGPQIPTNEWTHVAITRAGTLITMYINGKLVSQTNDSGLRNITNGSGIFISGWPYLSSVWLNGQVDEVRMWNTAQDSNSIRQKMRMKLNGDESGLLSLWHFDEPSGETAWDASPHGNNGTGFNGASRTISGAMAPLTPTGLFAMSGNGQVTLKWNKNPESDIVRYRIFAGTSPDPDVLADSTTGGINDTTIVIGNLTNNTLYYFRITAVNASGQQSPFSSEDAAVPVVEAGNALDLSMTEGYVQLTGSFENVQISISAWINPAFPHQSAIFSNRGSCGTNHDGFAFGILPGGELYVEYGPGCDIVTTPGDEILANRWTYVALTMDGDTMRLYVNGVEKANGHYSRTYSPGGAVIGMYNNGWGFYRGLLDEFSFWHRALSPGEISNNMHKPWKGNEPGLYALYHFDEPSGFLTAHDGSVNGFNGLLAGIPSPVFIASGAMVPFAPKLISTHSANQQVYLKWSANTETDFDKYHLYGGLTANPTTLLASTTPGNPMDTTIALNGLTLDSLYYFCVAGVDSAGQIGAFSNERVTVPVVEAGNAVTLDGSAGYVSVPDDPVWTLGSNPFTIETWVNFSTISPAWIISHDNGINNQDKWGILFDGSLLRFHINDPGNGPREMVSIPWNPLAGHWYHVAVTRNGNDFSLFVNGYLLALESHSDVIADPNVPLMFGMGEGGGYLNGSMDEVRIWNLARTQEELRTGMIRPAKGDETGLIGLWHFDEPEGCGIAFNPVENSLNGEYIGSTSKTRSGAMAPLAPTGVTAMSHLPAHIQVQWNSNAEPDVNSYIVYRSQTNGFIPSHSDSIGKVVVPDTTFTDFSVVPGNYYYYRITAVDSASQKGMYSDQAGLFYGSKMMVYNTLDAGFGSLRAAVDTAIAWAGPDTIRFSAALKDSVIRINSSLILQSGNGNGTVIDGDVDGDNLPDITIDGQRLAFSGVQIFGSGNHVKNLNIVRCGSAGIQAAVSIEGFDANGNVLTGNYIGTDLSGTDTTETGNHCGVGLYENAHGNFIGLPGNENRNIISGNGNGVYVQSSDTNHFVNNFIGTDKNGTAALGNIQHGMWIVYSNRNAVGDGTTNGLNIVSGNTFGLRISGSDGTSVLGNYFGLDISGTSAVPNSTAIHLDFCTHTQLGDGTPGGRNIISGNATGIEFYSSFADGMTSDNMILGNYIGTDYSGTVAVPNGYGILINDRVMFNRIGDGTAGGRNIISGNSSSGVAFWASEAQGQNIFNGYHIGINAAGNVLGNGTGFSFSNGASGDSLIGNVIAYNSGFGISCDGANTDSNAFLFNSIYNNANAGIHLTNGAQQGVPPPVIQFLTYDSTVSGTASSNALVQICADSADQGRLFLDTVRADGSGNWSKKVAIPPGIKITALQDSNGNTSMFSNPYLLTGDIDLAGKTQIHFGSVALGTQATDTLTVYNQSAGLLSVSSVSVKNGTAAFEVLNPSFADIMPGDSAYFIIRFSPSDFVSFADTLQITSNDPDEPLAYVELSGTGIPGVLTSSGDYDFGDVPVSMSDSAILKLYASGGSVQVDSIALATGLPYTLSGLPSLPHVIDTGDSAEFSIHFLPTALGSFADVVRIVNNSGTSPVTINLTGNGVSGALTTSFSSYNFGNVPVSVSDTTELKLYATGGSFKIDSLYLINNAGFTVQNVPGLPHIIDMNDSLTLRVIFGPTTFGSFSDVLRIVNNSITSPINVNLTGNGLPGNLSLSSNDLNYPLIQTGDSSVAQFKMYPTLGVVRVDSIRLVSQHYVMTPVTLPQILSADNHDTVTVTVTYRPQSAGHHTDTVYVYSNAVQYSLWTLKLEGDAYSNSAPNSFALKSVGTNNLTNSRTPLLSWENRGDPDGDVIQYRVDVSLQSDFATPADTAATYDSAYTVRATLDSSAIYYWRVTARDPKGAETVSETGQFRIDAVAAELTLGTFFGSVLKQYLSVNVIAGKPMRVLAGMVGLRDAGNALKDTSALSFDLESAARRFYQASYKLTTAGKLFLTITGADSAYNVTNLSRVYTIGAIAKEQALAMVSENGGWQISAPKRTFSGDGYLMVNEQNNETKTVHGQSVITMAKISGQWADVGEGLNIQGSAPLREGQGITITLRYDEDGVSELQSRYTDYDERKIGLYFENNGKWIYTGGEGKNGQVQAKAEQYGAYKLMYNPDHEFLPVKAELAQNYPNPFNPVTTIRFGIPQDGKVKLTIYNMLGQKVKELVNDSRNAGYYNVIWNGRSDRGSVVSSGIYLYRLETTQGIVVRKMALVK